MPTAENTRASKKKKAVAREYSGERPGKEASDFLNRCGDHIPAAAIELMDAYRKFREAPETAEMKGQTIRLRNLRWMTLVGILRKYRFALIPDENTGRVSYYVAEDDDKGEQDVVPLFIMPFLELTQSRLESNLIQCAHCQSWFLRRFEHQQYDRDECKTAALAADPEHKLERRQYMKELRRRKKLLKRRK